MLLTAKSSLPAAATKELQRLKPQRIIVVGGTGAVSNKVAIQLKSLTSVVQRVAGKDRFDTSQKINKAAFPKHTQTYLATRFQFPDALAGAALAGAKGAPLYVVHPGCIPAEILTGIKDSGSKRVTLLGGIGALDNNAAGLGRC